jgi:hypothetical protein
MERDAPGALRAPAARLTPSAPAAHRGSHHVTLWSCSLYITRVCLLAAVLRLTTRPPAAPVPPASLPFFSACESVSVLRQAARLFSLAAVLRPGPLAAPPAPLSAAFGRTAVLPNPASLAGDDASAARYTRQHTEALK